MTDIDTREVINTLLRKDFEIKGWGFDNFVTIGTEVMEQQEMSHKVMGKLADSLEIVKGKYTLQKFCQALEDTTGRRVSYHSVRHYRWVYRRLKDLDLPDDLSYKTWEALASTKNPKMWLTRTMESGWSTYELRREIRKATGKEPHKELLTCPHCNHQWFK